LAQKERKKEQNKKHQRKSIVAEKVFHPTPLAGTERFR
jgi:hypothetical protein